MHHYHIGSGGFAPCNCISFNARHGGSCSFGYYDFFMHTPSRTYLYRHHGALDQYATRDLDVYEGNMLNKQKRGMVSTIFELEKNVFLVILLKYSIFLCEDVGREGVGTIKIRGGVGWTCWSQLLCFSACWLGRSGESRGGYLLFIGLVYCRLRGLVDQGI